MAEPCAPKIVDRGDVHSGDPAMDLIAARLVLPPEAHGPFREEYGRIDEETWILARFRALAHAGYLSVYGDEPGAGDLGREGRLGLGDSLLDRTLGRSVLVKHFRETTPVLRAEIRRTKKLSALQEPVDQLHFIARARRALLRGPRPREGS